LRSTAKGYAFFAVAGEYSKEASTALFRVVGASDGKERTNKIASRQQLFKKIRNG
jgi:hypothetical protein